MKTKTNCIKCTRRDDCPGFDSHSLYGFCPGFTTDRKRKDYRLHALFLLAGVILGYLACAWELVI